MDDKQWLEISIKTDAEMAEAISEAIFPYVEGGVALEQVVGSQGACPLPHRGRPELVEGSGVGEHESEDRWEDEAASGPVIVHAYLPKDDALEQRRAKVAQALFYLNMVRPIPQPTYRDVAQSDWAESWKASFKPLRIGQRILIRPSWIDEREAHATPGDIVLALDPGMAFGTGLHPTTQLCAMALEEHVRPGMRVLDVGSGSGVLSILAARLGASDVLGVDTDEQAERVARENVGLNGVSERVRIERGSHDQTRERFDLVVANILADVIASMLKGGLVERGKRFIFSGILDTQAEDVIRSCHQAGLRLIEQKQMLDWVCLICERQAENPTGS